MVVIGDVGCREMVEYEVMWNVSWVLVTDTLVEISVGSLYKVSGAV